jgi:hypothetical protein
MTARSTLHHGTGMFNGWLTVATAYRGPDWVNDSGCPQGRWARPVVEVIG